MTYLICEQCGGYYELQEGEKFEDFSDECECGGKLHYAQSLQNLDDFVDSESALTSISGTALNPDGDIDSESVDNETQSKNRDENDEKYQDVDLLDKETIDDTVSLNEPRLDKSGLDKSKLNEFKLSTELQEILDVKGSLTIHGNDSGKYIKVFSDGIETDSGQFIRYSNILSIQDIYNPTIPNKSGISGLISYGYSLIASKNWSFKITYTEGELEFKGVKKNDAQRFVSFVNRIIKHR